MKVYTKKKWAEVIKSEIIKAIDQDEVIDYIELNPAEMKEAYNQLKDPDRKDFSGNTFNYNFCISFEGKPYEIKIKFIKVNR